MSFCDKYFEEYGTITCGNIQRQLYGRMFCLDDPQELKKLDDTGGHSNPENCPRIIANAAIWTTEIILKNG